MHSVHNGSTISHLHKRGDADGSAQENRIEMEEVEETQNENKEPDEAGNAAVAGLQKREHSKGILGD